jgi:hypothetical protein
MAESGAPTLAGWKFHDQHIQTNQLSTTAISAESTLVAGGPPMLEQLRDTSANQGVLAEGGTQGTDPLQPTGPADPSPEYTTKSDVVFPIGLLESAAVQQNKQVQRIFEIGSARSYFIPGRTLQGLNLGRIFFNGPSLLRCLYAVYRDANAAVNYPANTQALTIPFKTEQTAGYGQFLINLQSDLFNQPFGLGFFFKDQKNRWYGAFYCEMVFVIGHQLSISAGSVLLVEGVTCQFDTVRPIDIVGAKASGTGLAIGIPPAFAIGAPAPVTP